MITFVPERSHTFPYLNRPRDAPCLKLDLKRDHVEPENYSCDNIAYKLQSRQDYLFRRLKAETASSGRPRDAINQSINHLFIYALCPCNMLCCGDRHWQSSQGARPSKNFAT
ncbi:hypothetical protein PYW08_002201 [Mythimna loreyi]|uniref:Uncharacterized protein n=1 Tax=Mythimna loreyi TaxID=667449 RepID=A0ACC2R5E7_9NEOP|nr:hypothetical protein PYW08_002201 [Mythimna loreyi]